jgi:glyoxylase-like metal-dependent hydrolase (beta-lactamase superfamily II)
VLVDTFLTSEQAQTLADWVAASGKNLTAIYVTHGRGDHFFGLVPLLERFPRAKAIATPKSSKPWNNNSRRRGSILA